MKKTSLLLTIILLALAASSQIKVGVKGGANFSNIRGADVEGSKGQAGFHVGALADIGLFDKFSLQPELLYSLEGAKADAGEGIESRINLNYINIPVLFKYTSTAGFFAATGPQIGFLTTAKAKIEGTSTSVKDSFKSTNLSWTLGIGYLSSINLGFDLRYNLGLSKLVKEGDAKAYGSVFQLGVFYILGHTGK